MKVGKRRTAHFFVVSIENKKQEPLQDNKTTAQSQRTSQEAALAYDNGVCLSPGEEDPLARHVELIDRPWKATMPTSP